MITRRKALLVLGALAALPALAQQQPRVFRIGFLGSGSAATQAQSVDAFRAGLRDLGYAEGKNLLIEFRWADGRNDRVAALAAELVRLKVDVIVVAGTPSAHAAKQATSTIPIVSVAVGDPLRSGLVASLARPGGNITGLTQISAELAGKRLQILKDALPHVSRVALLWNPENASNVALLKDSQAAARAVGLTLLPVEVRDAREFENAFARMMRERPDALIATADGVHRVRLAWIIEFAAKRRLPAMYQEKEMVEAGGLMSYGASRPDLFRRTALHVDKILKGAKPGDLPFEQPTQFEMVINLRVARTLGLKIPQSALLQADEVIQ